MGWWKLKYGILKCFLYRYIYDIKDVNMKQHNFCHKLHKRLEFPIIDCFKVRKKTMKFKNSLSLEENLKIIFKVIGQGHRVKDWRSKGIHSVISFGCFHYDCNQCVNIILFLNVLFPPVTEHVCLYTLGLISHWRFMAIPR